MTRLKLDAQTLRQELQSFNQRLLDNYRQLKSLPTISCGDTPHDCIWQEDKVRLLRYTPASPNPDIPPLLICYALVNRPYMLDLQPDRSLLRKLLAQGLNVYLLDWGYPDAGDRFLDLDDYINHYLHRAVQAVCADAQRDQAALLGVCQGGSLSLCYTALHPEQISHLITLVTPVDFHTQGFHLSELVQHLDVDLAVKTYGNIPGLLLNEAYRMLLPMRTSIEKHLQLSQRLSAGADAENYLRMERWLNDSPDQAGEAFRQFVVDFFQRNLLYTGGLQIGKHRVELQQITQPLLNVYARSDHLVPPASSRALAGLTGSRRYEELALDAGHIGVFVSAKAGQQLPVAVRQWLERDS